MIYRSHVRSVHIGTLTTISFPASTGLAAITICPIVLSVLPAIWSSASAQAALPTLCFIHRRTLSFSLYRLSPSFSFTPALLAKKNRGGSHGSPATAHGSLSANSFVSR